MLFIQPGLQYTGLEVTVVVVVGDCVHGGPLEAPFVAPISMIDWIGSITLGQMGELLPLTVPECVYTLTKAWCY